MKTETGLEPPSNLYVIWTTCLVDSLRFKMVASRKPS